MNKRWTKPRLLRTVSWRRAARYDTRWWIGRRGVCCLWMREFCRTAASSSFCWRTNVGGGWNWPWCPLHSKQQTSGFVFCGGCSHRAMNQQLRAEDFLADYIAMRLFSFIWSQFSLFGINAERIICSFRNELSRWTDALNPPTAGSTGESIYEVWGEYPLSCIVHIHWNPVGSRLGPFWPGAWRRPSQVSWLTKHW